MRPSSFILIWLVFFAMLFGASESGRGQPPNPVISTVFPPGGQVGTTIEVAVTGSGLGEIETLDCQGLDARCQPVGKNRFKLTLPADAATGMYDLRAVCASGLSSPQAFLVGNRQEVSESTEKPKGDTVQDVPLDVSINGRIQTKGNVDNYNFTARAGERVIIECWAERIDSPLRAVLELVDASGRLLQSSRGFFGIDPLIVFDVPADGQYSAKLYDLTYTGSPAHRYRLDIDTGPRVAFALPAVVEAGKTNRVSLYGWNLQSDSSAATDIETQRPGSAIPWEQIEVDISAPKSDSRGAATPLRLQPHQIAVDGFAYRLPGGHAPLLLGVTDTPIVQDGVENHAPLAAQSIDLPCEISGQLITPGEQDWYAIDAKRGEVLWFEAYGQRIGSPVDLDLSVLDWTGEKELVRMTDELLNLGDVRFPSNHLDPSGRWVAPADGRYLVMIRSLIGDGGHDLRRVYRLAVHREDADFQLAAVPLGTGPRGVNLWKGGRTCVELLAFRRRGQTGSIRVVAQNLPAGVTCPDVWLGPDVRRAPLVISAESDAPPFSGVLELVGIAEGGLRLERPVRGTTQLATRAPQGAARITATVPLGVATSAAPLRISASSSQQRLPQGSVIHLAVDVQRQEDHADVVRLRGVGLPENIGSAVSLIPSDANKGFLSLALPASLPPGKYTLAVAGETTALFPVGSKSGKAKPKNFSVVSNPVTFEVYPAPFILSVALDAPLKVRRGEFIRLDYSAKRKNGFIGKIHTVLGAPDGVEGLRARGVTFVGQTDKGTLQIIASGDAPLGRQPRLCLEAVGTVEDEPVYQARCFLNLEVIP